jgi:hypothetical protein
MLLYIDPGTGSMLFTILIGVVSTLFFFLKKVKIKIKFILSGGKTDKQQAERIPYLIFSDSKRYWNVFQPICDEFEKRKIKLEYWTVSEDDPALEKHYSFVECRYIGNLNQAFAKLNMLNAGIVLSTTPGLDVYQWKRSKNTEWYVHILHAAGEAIGYRMFGLDHYDAVLLSGEYQIDQIRKLEEMRGLPPKDLRVVGLTYLDAMQKRLEMKKNCMTADGDSSEKHIFTVLLAPSWGASSILCRYGDRILSGLVKTGYRIIVRPHPQSMISDIKTVDSLRKKYPDNEKFSWNFDNDNFNVLKESDIMISDFSGVIFDYSLIFDRPVIYTDTDFDKSPYDAAWFEGDKPYWTFKTLPSIGIPLKESDFSRLKEVIDRAVSDSGLAEGRKRAREETWMYPGESTKRTVEYLEEKQRELQSNEKSAE